MSQEEDPIEQEFIDKACDKRFVARKEEFINRAQAIERFEKRVGRRAGHRDIAGSHFSLEILKEFICAIDKYNTSLNDEDHPSRIAGVRIWQAQSDAFQSDRLREDVIMMPTMSDYSDIHATTDGDVVVSPRSTSNNELLMLSSSRPCPNLCGTSGPKFFYEY